MNTFNLCTISYEFAVVASISSSFIAYLLAVRTSERIVKIDHLFDKVLKF